MAVADGEGAGVVTGIDVVDAELQHRSVGDRGAKISPIVRVANMSVGGAELPRPAEASAGKSWWKPKLKLPIKSAA